MLKFFYRLKRRRGVVLFAVIAIMTLLIVMASVAYFTTRSSYQTVISNYDFSQTYLSATSVADMMLSAVAFDSSRSADNNYSNLRSLITAMENDVQEDIEAEAKKCSDAGEELNITEIHYTDGKDLKKLVFYDQEVDTVNHIKYRDKTPSGETNLQTLKSQITITGSSDNIKGKTGDEIIDASMSDPVKGGILDACSVEIALDWVKTLPVDDEEQRYKSNRFYYTFTTTAYYRGNSITVQDTVYHDATLGASAGLPDFDTFFTATGQILSDKGKIKESDRRVVINTHLISDSAFFQNKDTFISRFMGAAAGVKFAGGLQTTGNLWLDADMNGKFQAPDGARRHDWIIGGDLYVSGNSSLDFNGNCLYVKGDVYIASTAGNAFSNLGSCVIEGNVYVLQGANSHFTFVNYDKAKKVDADGNQIGSETTSVSDIHRVTPQGVFVQGSTISERGKQGGIYKSTLSDPVYEYYTVEEGSLPSDLTGYPTKTPDKYKDYHSFGSTEYEKTEVITSGGNKYVRHYLTISDYFGVINKMYTESCEKGGRHRDDGYYVEGSNSCNTSNSNTFSDSTCKVYYNTSDLVVDSSLVPSGKRASNYADLDGHITKLLPVEKELEDGTKEKIYEYSLNSPIKVSDILSGSGGLARRGFDSYSAKQEAIDNVLEIDFSSWASDGGSTQTVGTCSETGEAATLTNGGSYWALDLPFVEGGYTLKFKTEEYWDDTYVHKPTPENPWNYAPRGMVKGVKLPFSFSSGAEWRVNIETGTYTNDDGDEVRTMPIVLAANFNDGNTEYNPSEGKYGTPVDANDCNAFSWKFGDTNNNCDVIVTVKGDDFVIFEMGNYTPGEDGEYVKYDKNNATSVETVTYYAADRQLIGSEAQVEEILSNVGNNVNSLNGDDTAWNSLFLDKKTGQIKNGNGKGSNGNKDFRNKIILVSNKNDNRKAYDAWGFNSTCLCGYLYAPNGSFAAHDGSRPGATPNLGHPLFGGMIVSDYVVYKNKFLYATPDPDLVQGLADGLTNITGTSTDGKNAWTIDDADLGKNYLG